MAMRRLTRSATAAMKRSKVVEDITSKRSGEKRKKLTTKARTKKKRSVKSSTKKTTMREKSTARPSSTKARKPPAEWKKTWNIIEELREDRTAPVDEFGSEALPLRPPAVSQQTYEYQTLIALMLSSQTKDPVVGSAMRRLQNDLEPDGLNIVNVRAASESRIRELIYGVGFQNKKAVYIKRATEMLVSDFNARVPDSFESLVRLPGVGPKMALIVLNAAFGKCVGVSIDTHLHRMLRQLSWVHPNSKSPEHTRRELESWLPRAQWPMMNLVWVGLGQEIQTEPGKLIRKALVCSDPPGALRLLRRLFGSAAKLSKIAKRERIEIPPMRT